MTSKEQQLVVVDEYPSDSIPKGKVKTLINEVTMQYDAREVDEIFAGDVFWHKLVGGKKRPWLVLKVEGDLLIAAALTTNPEQLLAIPFESRFWKDNFVTPTISVFECDVAKEMVTFPIGNAAALETICDRFSDLMNMIGGE